MEKAIGWRLASYQPFGTAEDDDDEDEHDSYPSRRDSAIVAWHEVPGALPPLGAVP
jgi:hypothetical protein